MEILKQYILRLKFWDQFCIHAALYKFLQLIVSTFLLAFDKLLFINHFPLGRVWLYAAG